MLRNNPIFTARQKVDRFVTMQLMDQKLHKILYQLSPYALAVGTSCFFLLIDFVVFSLTGKQLGLIILFPAVVVSSWYGGLKAGLTAAIVLSGAQYYFLATVLATRFDTSFFVAQLLIFFIEAIVISFLIDFGHRQESITEYKKSNKEQQKHIEALQMQLASAKEAIAARDEFLSIASHELKTPLTTVLMQIQITLHSIRNVSLAEFSVGNLLTMLQSAQVQTKRLAKMINDLLNISLLTTRKMTLEKEDVDLTTLARDIVENFSPRFHKEGSDITFMASRTILGKWDRLRLEQAIDNIISNALKYGNKKPVEVVLKKEGSNALLYITDHGIGIGDGETDKIFQLFKRGEATEKDYKGLGIGLFIAREIIVLHGGVISVESKQGNGTTFTLTLPIQNT